MAIELPESIAAIERLLRKRIRSSNEDLMRQDVVAYLREGGIEFVEEHRVNKRDRFDIFVESLGLVIELKVNQSYTQVASQLLRYADHECVAAILLVTSQASHRQIGGMENDRAIPIVVVHTGFNSFGY